ncbi:MAG: hypothetical protein AAGI34_11880, partial [Pseudomonadota bacterium]
CGKDWLNTTRRSSLDTKEQPMRLALLALLAAPALAGEADVLAVDARQSGSGWRFEVTVAHADTGWDHYADAWRVVAPDGTVLGTRTLHHPHVDEQPFTRALSGVAIPEDVERVIVESHDSVHGWGGAQVEVVLER